MDITEVKGSKIRALRDAIGWTREHFSEKSGVPVRTIEEVENEKSKNPGIETLKALLSALPNYRPEKSASVVLAIQSRILVLNDEQLGVAFRFIDKLAASASSTKSDIG